MKAWRLFAHSVRQVFGNLGPALRISALPSVLLAAASLWFTMRVPDLSTGTRAIAPQDFPFIPFLLVWLLMMIVPLWIAVDWHRFVLRNEAPGAILPAWHGGRMLAYFGRLIVLGLLVGIPVMILAFILLAAFGRAIALFMHPDGTIGAGGIVLLLLLYGLLLLPAMWVFNRLSPVLPAAALGEPLTLNDAWQATAGDDATFLLVSLIFMLAAGAGEVALALFQSIGSPVLVMPVAAVIYWAQMMVGASVLTTIYGHYVEKRPLVGSSQ